MSGREQSRVRKSYNDLMLEYWKRKHENTRENRYETARPDSVVAVSIRFHHHHAEWIAAFTKGRAEYFTGSGDVEELVPATAPARTSGGRVTFKPGARSAWHTHPLGQILIVTAGTGWIQEWGGRKEEIREGDVVRIPPG